MSSTSSSQWSPDGDVVGAVTELGARGWTKLLRLGLQTAHGEAELGRRLARGETGWECISQGTTRRVRRR
jgi:hypothetical protein